MGTENHLITESSHAMDVRDRSNTLPRSHGWATSE